MGMNLIYTPLETIFDATMEREGRNITAYTSGSEFQLYAFWSYIQYETPCFANRAGQ